LEISRDFVMERAAQITQDNAKGPSLIHHLVILSTSSLKLNPSLAPESYLKYHTKLLVNIRIVHIEIMPTTRRSTGNTASSRSKARPANQTKLAFSNRVTKASAYDDSAKKPSVKVSPQASPAPEVFSIEPEEEADSADTSLVSIDDEVYAPLDPVDEEARNVNEAQIKKFYTDGEKTRMAPRVHQGDITISERLLRSWDVDSRYGVSG
jgi:DNA polymerase delta subunit 4